MSCRYAALAKALNNAKQPVEVIRLWEEAEQPGVVTDAFATEYLKGLVYTNRINDFAAPEAMQRFTFSSVQKLHPSPNQRRSDLYRLTFTFSRARSHLLQTTPRAGLKSGNI